MSQRYNKKPKAQNFQAYIFHLIRKEAVGIFLFGFRENPLRW